MIDNEPAATSSAPSSSAPSSPLETKKRRWPRRLAWTALFLAALLVMAALGGAFWLRSAERAALPVLDGEIRLAGLSAPVTVRRDAHGVPHIDASTQDDLWVAQGYVTAQDRLWEMDTFRRHANGELAELMGPSLVKHDRAQRVLQLRNTARRIYAGMSAEDRRRFDDYAHGVNLFIAQHGSSLPAEFRLLHYRPQPWTGADSVSVGLMMVQTLDTHWPTKLSRERIEDLLHHNQKLIRDLYPVGSWRDRPPTGIELDLSQPHPMPPPSDDDDDEDERTQSLDGIRELRHLLGLPDCDGCAPGSNNWVVAGRHTASGMPLLSNDMHLGVGEPDIWYMADLRAPGFHAAGVTLPGMPFVVAGHNEHVAWGFTALFADVQDLYYEKLDGKGNFEDGNGAWKPLRINHEVIKVRGGKDVAFDVQSTAHGPLINSLLKKETRPLALKWTLYDPSLTIPPIFKINTAASAAEFSSIMGQWSYPTQNVVFADDQGHIGYNAVGRVPIRPTIWDRPLLHDEWAGRSGNSPDSREWQAYIPYDQMPHAFDPPSGFLATANSRVTTDSSPYPLTHNWIDPYRAERIYKALQGRDGLKPADMLAVQTDIYSEVDQEMGHRFAYAIDHAEKTDARLRQAADLMRSWDGRLSTDSAAASVVTQTRTALRKLILEAKLGKEAEDYHWGEANFAEEEIVMHASPDWLPREYKNWDELITEAVRRGMKAGKAPRDVNKWTYGSWHVIDVEHPLAGYLPFIGRMAGTGRQPLSGDATTVKQVGRSFGPSQRFTMDWSDVDGSTENIVMGESSDPFSPYFRDQWKDYYAGTTFALPFTPAAVASQTKHTLRLRPSL